MLRTRRVWRRAGPIAAVLLVGMFVLSGVPSAGAQNFAPGAAIDFRGFANGMVAYAGLLESGGTRVVNGQVATSGAAVDADANGLNGQKLNEVSRIFQAPVGNKLSYARGSGLEIGLGVTVPQPPDEENQIVLAEKAEQSAPPDNDEPDLKEIAVPGDPLAYASLLRGEAIANAQDSGLLPEVCVLGDDLARGLGYGADVELIDTGDDGTGEDSLEAALLALDDQDPQRSVSQSVSRETLIPTGQPNNFGLASEVRETIAPVTLVQTDSPAPGEDPRALTIELLGEWVLRATATGRPGGAKVFYGTGTVESKTDILRLINGAGEVTDVFAFEDLLGPDGLTIPGDPLINISIAEQPRKLAKPGEFPDPESKPELAGNGTSAVAAVDVLRIRLLAPEAGTLLGEIRVGHMEVGAQVPVGGVNCPIPVTKTADPRTINITPQEPDTSHITITVHNVFDCDLTNVELTDRIRQREGDPDFKLIAAEPDPESPAIPTGTLRESDVVWNLGTIKKGDKKSVSLDLQSATKGGIIRDIAEAKAKLANCAGEDVAGLAIAGLNITGLSNVLDIVIPTPITGAGGATTAATGAGIASAALAVAAVLRRRLPGGQ